MSTRQNTEMETVIEIFEGYFSQREKEEIAAIYEGEMPRQYVDNCFPVHIKGVVFEVLNAIIDLDTKTPTRITTLKQTTRVGKSKIILPINRGNENG